MIYIYVLIDPRNLTNRYIGKTDKLKTRYRTHCRKQHENNYRAHWLSELRAFGLKPIMEVVETCDESIWERREQWWIAYGRFLEWPLTNLAAGGGGTSGTKLTEEHKRKIGEKSKGNTNMLGKIFTPEHCQNLSKATKGIPKTAEHNRKNSEAQRGELNHRSVLTNTKVKDVRWFMALGVNNADLGRMYGVSRALMKEIKHKRAWAWLE